MFDTRVVMAVAVVAVASLATAGCYQTRSVAPTYISGLKRGGYNREIVLRHGPFGAHVGPRSWVRFGLRDGRQTAWLEARKLRVNPMMVVTTDGYARSFTGVTPGIHAIPWEELGSIEVNDLDSMKTVAGVTAGTGLVVLAVMAEIMITAGIGALTNGNADVDVGLMESAIGLVGDEALKRPDETADVDPELDPGFAALARDSVPLFSRRALRRDMALFSVATEGGLDAAPTVSSVGGVTIGVRVANILELGVGARSSFLPASSDGTPARSAAIPFFRLVVHIDLDAGRRIAIAAGIDLGGLPGQETHARFLYGLRARLTDNLQIGIYPWNPLGKWQTLPGRAVTHHSHLNLLELTWLI